MKNITFGLFLLVGLTACGTAGSLSVSGESISYDLPTVKYEKHERVVLAAKDGECEKV